MHFNTETKFSSNYIHHIEKRWQAQLKYNELKEMFSWKCPWTDNDLFQLAKDTVETDLIHYLIKTFFSFFFFWAREWHRQLELNLFVCVYILFFYFIAFIFIFLERIFHCFYSSYNWKHFFNHFSLFMSLSYIITWDGILWDGLMRPIFHNIYGITHT